MKTKQFSLGHFSIYSEMNFSENILEKLNKLMSLISTAENRQNVPEDYKYSKSDKKGLIPSIVSIGNGSQDVMENAQSLNLIIEDIQDQKNYFDTERRMVYPSSVLEEILNQFTKILTELNNTLEKNKITELEIDITSLEEPEIVDIIIGNKQTTITIENNKVKILTYGDIVEEPYRVPQFIIPPPSTID